MTHYAVKLDNGTIGIVKSDKSLAQVTKQVIMREGSRHVRSVTEATDEEVAFFKAMGGYISEE